MKGSEFERWLKSQGATIVSAKGSHKKVTLNGKTTIFPITAVKR